MKQLIESRKNMTAIFTRKQMGLAISCALALGVVTGAARAETINTEVGYVVGPPNAVVRNSNGGCWRTGTGPAETARVDCGAIAVPAPLSKVEEPAPQPVAAAAVAPEPIPQPVAVVAVAPKRVAEQLTLNADTLFDFNKSVLRPAGKVALDDFVDKTKDINPEVITAVGHTDRFGSERYNQLLSEQRAEAVKTYMVSQGIAPDRIHTEGKGEMQPVTTAGECDGAKSAKVIACLQPDRSVEVEVVGTRIANR